MSLFFSRCTLHETHETHDTKHVLSVWPSSSVSSQLNSFLLLLLLDGTAGSTAASIILEATPTTLNPATKNPKISHSFWIEFDIKYI